MSRKTEIREILEDELYINDDGVIRGIDEASEALDEYVDEAIIREKEFEQMTEPQAGIRADFDGVR